MTSADLDPRRWKALAALGVAFLMVVLDISIVNVALPSIQTDLGFSPADIQWVVSGYALTFGGFLLLGGRAGDLLGRKRLFMIGLALFAGCSLLAGLSTSSGMLIAARALQGTAGAVLSPSAFSIVTVTFPEGPERNKALGMLGAVAASGAAVGALLGGVLTQYAGWEWIFFVNVPIGVGALFFANRLIRESRNDELHRHFDSAGAATITAALMLLVYALTQANGVGWGSARTIGILVASGALHTAFIVIELRSPSPLVPLSFFRRKTPASANVIGFGIGTILFGTFFLLTLYMQQVLGLSAVRTGFGCLAAALTSIFASGAAQALVTRAGVKPVLTTGILLLGGGLLYFTQISAGGSYFADLLPGFILLGVGMGFSFVPVSIAALAGVPPLEAGLASGLINTSQQIGGALGVAILTTVSTTRTDHLLAKGTGMPAALTGGFSLAFWIAAAFSAAVVVATIVTLRREEFRAVPAGAPAA